MFFFSPSTIFSSVEDQQGLAEGGVLKHSEVGISCSRADAAAENGAGVAPLLVILRAVHPEILEGIHLYR